MAPAHVITRTESARPSCRAKYRQYRQRDEPSRSTRSRRALARSSTRAATSNRCAPRARRDGSARREPPRGSTPLRRNARGRAPNAAEVAKGQSSHHRGDDQPQTTNAAERPGATSNRARNRNERARQRASRTRRGIRILEWTLEDANTNPSRTSAQYRRASAAPAPPVGARGAPSRARCAEARVHYAAASSALSSSSSNASRCARRAEAAASALGRRRDRRDPSPPSPRDAELADDLRAQPA